MGDDMEKFGVWPGTFDHCYKDAWLEKFFVALEENSSWLHVSTPSEYLSTHTPAGRADLPTASYTEMMEWALPTRVRQRYNQVLKEFASRNEVLAFFARRILARILPQIFRNQISSCTKNAARR